jgi:hypothetical protein
MSNPNTHARFAAMAEPSSAGSHRGAAFAAALRGRAALPRVAQFLQSLMKITFSTVAESLAQGLPKAQETTGTSKKPKWAFKRIAAILDDAEQLSDLPQMRGGE